MAEVKPELFADGTCGKPLPSGELLQAFKFGQFSPLKVLDDTSEAFVVVGKMRQPTATGSSSTVRAMNPLSPIMPTALTSGSDPRVDHPEFTFKQLLTGETSIQVPPEAVPLSLAQEQIARVIATGQVEYQNNDWDVALAPGHVSDLLNGRSVEIEGRTAEGSQFFTIHPNESLIRQTASEPSVTEFEVAEQDLSHYLASPWLPGQDDLVYAVKFNDGNVRDLARQGHTIVQAGNRGVGIKIIKRQVDPKVIPGLGNGQSSVENGGKYQGGGKTAGGTASGTVSTMVLEGYQPRALLRAEDFKGVTLAIYFEWNQEWVLKGFSRGRLLHSLSLAPQEETTIELSTWDRRKRTLEQSSVTETEQSLEDEEKTQDATEVYRELTKKDEFQWKVGGDLDAQYNGGTVNIKLKAQANAQDKTNAEDVTKNTTKSLREGIQKAAAKVKTQRSSKISETTEIGQEEKITRKVRNPNLCHTLNLDYFEVITHYNIITTFNKDAMRFCAMIPNPVARETFPAEFVRQHEQALWDALLDRSLASGFDGLRLLRAREVAQAELEQKKRRRQSSPVTSSPGPEAKPATTTQLSPEESAANNYLANLQAASKKVLQEGLIEGLRNALRSLSSDQSSLGTKKGFPRTIDLDQGKRYLAQQLFIHYYSQLAQTLGDIAAASGSLSIREWGPKLAPIMPSQASIPRPSQLNLESQEVKQGLLQEIVRPSVGGLFSWDWAWWWGEVKRVGLLEADDGGLGAVVEQFDKVYRAFLDGESRKSAATAGQALVQQAQAAQDQLSDEDRLEADFPLRDYAIATERAEVLLKHLMEHSQHYSFALFRSLPPQEQLEYIDRALNSIDTGFEPGFFQPRVVSQIGRFLLVPLNHEIIPKAAELLKLFQERINMPSTTDTVLLPSPGMTIEARLGQCSTCEEFIEESRKIELRRLVALARQAELEADRMAARLGVDPKQLDDPKPATWPLQVRIEQTPSP